MRANKRSTGQNQSVSAAGGRRSVRTWAHGHTHTRLNLRGEACAASLRAPQVALATSTWRPLGSHLQVQVQVGDPCWLLGRDVTDVSERVSAAQLSCSSPPTHTTYTFKKHLDLCILIDFRLLLANHARKQALRRPNSIGFRPRRPVQRQDLGVHAPPHTHTWDLRPCALHCLLMRAGARWLLQPDVSAGRARSLRIVLATWW